jgi:hypothetical protein
MEVHKVPIPDLLQFHEKHLTGEIKVTMAMANTCSIADHRVRGHRRTGTVVDVLESYLALCWMPSFAAAVVARAPYTVAAASHSLWPRQYSLLYSRTTAVDSRHAYHADLLWFLWSVYMWSPTCRMARTSRNKS